jgi:hypothetical protein
MLTIFFLYLILNKRLSARVNRRLMEETEIEWEEMFVYGVVGERSVLVG